MERLKKIKQDFHLKELIRGGSTAMVFKGIGMLFTYLLFLSIANLFGPENLGIFNTCWTILMIGAVVGKMGMDTAIVKFIAETLAIKKYNELKSIYRLGALLVLGGSVIIALIIIVSSNILSKSFFKTTENAYLLQLIGFTVIPLAQMSYNSEVLRGMKKITLFALFQNSSVYATLLILLLILYFIFGKPYIIIPSLTLGISILFILSFFMVRKQIALKSKAYSSSAPIDLKIRNIIRISLPMLLSNSLFLIMNWTDTLMLSHFKEEALVGIYNTAIKIAALNTFALSAINSIAAPKYAELFTLNDHSRIRRVVKQTSLMSFGLSFPVFLLILLFPGFLLSLFGEDFITGTTALLILVVGQAFSAFAGSTMNILNMTRKEKVARNILFLGVIVNFVLNLLLIPNYGIEGAAIATASSTVLWNTLAIVYIYKKYGFLTFPIKL